MPKIHENIFIQFGPRAYGSHTSHTHKQIACTLLTEPLNSQTSISSVHCSFSTLCYAVLRSSFYGCIESIFVCRKHNTFRQCALNVSIEPKPNSHTATDTHGHHVICFRSFNLFVFMRRGTSTTRTLINKYLSIDFIYYRMAAEAPFTIIHRTFKFNRAKYVQPQHTTTDGCCVCVVDCECIILRSLTSQTCYCHQCRKRTRKVEVTASVWIRIAHTDSDTHTVAMKTTCEKKHDRDTAKHSDEHFQFGSKETCNCFDTILGKTHTCNLHRWRIIVKLFDTLITWARSVCDWHIVTEVETNSWESSSSQRKKLRVYRTKVFSKLQRELWINKLWGKQWGHVVCVAARARMSCAIVTTRIPTSNIDRTSYRRQREIQFGKWLSESKLWRLCDLVCVCVCNHIECDIGWWRLEDVHHCHRRQLNLMAIKIVFDFLELDFSRRRRGTEHSLAPIPFCSILWLSGRSENREMRATISKQTNHHRPEHKSEKLSHLLHR